MSDIFYEIKHKYNACLIVTVPRVHCMCSLYVSCLEITQVESSVLLHPSSSAHAEGNRNLELVKNYIMVFPEWFSQKVLCLEFNLQFLLLEELYSLTPSPQASNVLY